MIRVCWLVITFFLCTAQPAFGGYTITRIKDIVNVEGIRDNLLVGYGLVVGLNGTGDNLNNTYFTEKGLLEYLERLGINSRGTKLKTKNVAAVMVTGALPPFARSGSRFDIAVSTLGDAKSLQDGTLLATTLLGADGQVYAVAQGKVSTGGFIAQGDGAEVSKNVTTNAHIVSGAIVEKEINFDLSSLPTIRLALKNPDLSTALMVEKVINKHMGEVAKANDPGTVTLSIPSDERERVVHFLAKIEKLEVEPDVTAKIIIDESSGTIVIGENVRILPIAVAQGNLTIRIKEKAEVFQPNPFAPDLSVPIVVPDTEIQVDEGEERRMTILPSQATLKDLVDGLNALGVGPRDLISIIQTIKASGAIQAEIEMR